MRSSLLLIFILSTLCLNPPLWAGYQFHKATLEEARWYVESSPVVCRMVHEISVYGEAVFLRKIKSELEFVVNVNQPATRPGEARLQSLPPEWKHFSFARNFGSVPVIQGRSPFYLSNSWATRMVAELQEGMDLHLKYRDWSDETDEISVRILGMNFNSAWDEFQDCEQGLLKVNFTDIKQNVILYAKGQIEPNSSAKLELDRMIRYMKADPSVRSVRIDGYTDSKGLQRVNIKVARARANAVKKYFVENGIKASKIKVVAHNELEAKFSNRTAAGRKKNRRVEVQLSR
ncbi:MAG: OmpA family protein [Gammaproteobacteria bacterium]|nr:OmpA family protein [Gammaproteobacteria bacterium]